MKLEYAQRFASVITRQLMPYCSRLEVAGSIRRHKSEVKDVEIVCIPKLLPVESSNLFGVDQKFQRNPGFAKVVNQWGILKGNAKEGKYIQREFVKESFEMGGIPENRINIDIFCADENNYGSILLIRTGDLDFSKLFMGTILPQHGYRAREGYVWRGSQLVSLKEEKDVFELVDIPFIEPHFRTKEILKKFLSHD